MIDLFKLLMTEVRKLFIVWKTDKVSKRAVIQYLLKKGMSGQDIHKDMMETLGEDASS